MTIQRTLGQTGEAIARQYLQQHGYVILETNWRLGKNEADIIAYHEGVVVFVEVKTRSNHDYGYPEEFVNHAKQRAYIRMANYYMMKRLPDEEARFDIIAIETDGKRTILNHIENAFSAVGQRLR